MKLLDQTYTTIRDNTFWLTNETFFYVIIYLLIYLFIYLFIVIIPFLCRSIAVAEFMPTILLFAHF